MGLEHEEAVRDFISEWECEHSWDSSQIERMLDLMAPEARYQVFAWEGRVPEEAYPTVFPFAWRAMSWPPFGWYSWS